VELAYAAGEQGEVDVAADAERAGTVVTGGDVAVGLRQEVSSDGTNAGDGAVGDETTSTDSFAEDKIAGDAAVDDERARINDAGFAGIGIGAGEDDSAGLALGEAGGAGA
jgi:hypothetical protein